VNPRSRRLALYAIGAIAILASANALAHSYAGLYDWAVHHRLGGWQAKSWPAEIDVFLAVGELALYIAYLDGWPARQRIWPWATALIGLAVSVAGNIGHIQAEPGQPVGRAARGEDDPPAGPWPPTGFRSPGDTDARATCAKHRHDRVSSAHHADGHPLRRAR
jgi:hypothetical protein